MAKTDDSFGSRLRFARKKWGLSQDELAIQADVGVATIARAENSYFDPRMSTAQKLADALHVRLEWLMTGDSDDMVSQNQMTIAEQIGSHTGPGSDNLPGFVVLTPCEPWFMDDDGEWQVEGAAERKKQR